MAINELPVREPTAHAMMVVMRKARPESHFDIVGDHGNFFVREIFADNREELHGQVPRHHGIGRRIVK